MRLILTICLCAALIILATSEDVYAGSALADKMGSTKTYAAGGGFRNLKKKESAETTTEPAESTEATETSESTDTTKSTDSAETSDAEFGKMLSAALQYRYGESPELEDDVLDKLDEYDSAWEAEYALMEQFENASFDDPELKALADSYLAGLRLMCAAEFFESDDYTENRPDRLAMKQFFSANMSYYFALEALTERFDIEINSHDKESIEMLNEAFDILLWEAGMDDDDYDDDDDIDDDDDDDDDDWTIIDGPDPQEPEYPTVTDGNFVGAVLDDDTVRIIDYKGPDAPCLPIPSEIDGHIVTEIGVEAFSYHEFENLVIPDTVREIQSKAFDYTEISGSLVFPENIVIGLRSFEYAELPDQLIIPQGAHVCSNAFAYCEELEILILENDVTLDKNAFEYAEKLKEVYLSPGDSIGYSAFGYIRTLETVALNENATGEGDIYIDENAFDYCSRLKNISIEP